ncbi:MAG: UDP-glucose 4-epimerase GalE [Flavobacteriaceae bacterium]|jgi:UDP-glucose 4-epimerase|nr:UDP-glucose 4-epimerase GalE [Flavobacteriaceae bacterium]
MILVTGGLGFIGAHTTAALLEKNQEVLIADDLSNSSKEVLNGIERATGKKPSFVELDLKNKTEVTQLFNNHKIQGIIHFAAFKAVGESVHKPIEYYENNTVPLLNLLLEIKKSERKIPFIFSSSCTVYGEANSLPITEEEPIKPAQSPYGNTKQIGEEILLDATQALENLNVISLRYFNPIGAHPSNEIGELPLGTPQNLVPFITQTAVGLHKQLTVFGNDYPTPDGTCVRDYIHVVDLAKAHIAALERLENQLGDHSYEVFNLGTGSGNSVLEVIASFERVSGLKLNYTIGPRRNGDVIAAYADTQKAEKVLGWKAKQTLDQAIASAWAWEQKIRS